MYNKVRSNAIRQQQIRSNQVVREFKEQKKYSLQDEFRVKVDGEKKLIYKYESEAQ